MARCLVCGAENHVCGPREAVVPVDLPQRRLTMAGGKLVRVQTGPTSYVKMTEEEAKVYQEAQVKQAEKPAAEPAKKVERKAK